MTCRVKVRPLVVEDASLLFSLTERNRAELIKWFEWPDQVTAEQGARDVITRWTRPGRKAFLVFYNGAAVGVVADLHDGEHSVPMAWLDAAVWGKGIASTAYKLAEIQVKSSSIQVLNTKSIRKAEKEGRVPVRKFKKLFRGTEMEFVEYRAMDA